MNTFLSAPSLDDLIRLLRAWRFWVFGALIGGLLGYGFSVIVPSDYRARATVIVSFNMEKAWPNKPDNQLFYYLERESRKVQEVAWADATLEQVTQKTGFSIEQLRSEKLELTQPQDGAWHLYASDPSANVAAGMASAWAEAFSSQVRQGIQTAIELDATRKALENSPGDKNLLAVAQQLEAKSLAITPELQVSVAQSENLVPARKSSSGVYVLAGAGLFWALAAMIILFTGKRQRG